MRISIVLACLLLDCNVFADDLADYVAEKYRPELGEIMSVEYNILMYKNEFLPALLAEAQDPKSPPSIRSRYLFKLGSIAGPELPELTFEHLRALAEDAEDAALKSEDHTLLMLTYAYLALGRSGTPEALAFLQSRASFDFWDGRPQPRWEARDSAGGSTPFTAQGVALAQLSYIPLPTVDAYLRYCLADTRYTSDPFLRNRLAIAVGMRASNLGEWNLRRAAWQKRAARLQASGATAVAAPSVPLSNSQTLPVEQMLPRGETDLPQVSTTNRLGSTAVASQTVPKGNQTPYSVAAIVLILLGLFIYLGRRKA